MTRRAVRGRLTRLLFLLSGTQGQQVWEAEQPERHTEPHFNHREKGAGSTYGAWSPVADPGQLSSLWMRRIRNCAQNKDKATCDRGRQARCSRETPGLPPDAIGLRPSPHTHQRLALEMLPQNGGRAQLKA